MIDLDGLNAEQQQVVLHGDGPCLVLAGAGSGKTRTVTHRVAYLLSQGVKPEEILLVTFTNKAAKEMIERVKALTGGEIHLPWSGTFHHIAYRILRRYAPILGYKNNFTILDSEDSTDLLKLCLKAEGIDRKEKRFPSASVLHSLISYTRNAEITLEEALDMKYPQWLSASETLSTIRDAYMQKKKEANAMDFDDLLVNLQLLLLKSETVRKKYAEQFRYVMVDEYQDTNTIQASIIDQFSSHHHNLLVVGDDAQSIYSFRAANIKNILDFEKKYPVAHVFRLETNYRSTPEIVTVANEVIDNNIHQYKKESRSLQATFTKPELHVFADQGEEASFVAGRILELRDEGVRLDQMAVLFRAAFHSQALELELTKRDIPYEYRGGVRFFERAHIKDVLAYLRIISNREDAVAWSRVLNMQMGIGPGSAEKIFQVVRTGDEHAFSSVGSVLSTRGQVGWNDFLQIWSVLTQLEDQHPADLIRAVLESKYREYLDAEFSDARERAQDIEQLALFAERYARDHADKRGESLTRFLAESSLQESFSQSSIRATDRRNIDDEEKVVLSTVHQAKGLEWEAVFVINLAAGQFPNDRAIRDAAGIEEERRLFYVAITRAKKQLYFSYPLVGAFDSTLSGPSMFLEEIPRDAIDEHSLLGETVFTDPSDTGDGITYVREDEPFASRPRPTSFLKSIDEL